MKTQISRWSHEPGKRRSGIYQQQGRMISDADLNELMELLRRRVDDALGEVVGSGGPRANDPGLVAAGAKLRRGVLYAEGVRGRLEPSASAVIANDGTFALEAQADFPSPQPLPNTGEQTLYADLWDLSATALQDPAQLDPGLHGADTCTRTHTLVQVKWCAKTIDPLTDAKNPRQGDARLGLAIREGSSDPDPCDPCAEEVALDKRIGNYLFRVEVHDVKGDANAPSEITLKWSSENGAEQHSQDAAPSEFKRGDWIYEFYSDKTERHSGVHLNGFAPARPVLVKDGWPDTPPDKADLPYVRRWDGYCVLTGGAGHWSIKMDSGTLQAKDLGRTFVQLPNDGTKPTHGHFTLDSKLTAYLSGLVLTLALDGRSFVAGDYWLAAVREDAPDAARVLPAESGPIGVTHRYVFLAHVKDKVVQDLTDEETRRLSFPPLANVTADRIGYSTGPGGGIVEQRWQDILAEPSPLVGLPFNVQDAIDRLVTKLESSDIGYNLPGCMGNTLRGRLYDPDPAHAAQKVNDVLDKLLCGLDSTSIPYKLAAATTIQNVLDTLATDVAARVKIAGDTTREALHREVHGRRRSQRQGGAHLRRRDAAGEMARSLAHRVDAFRRKPEHRSRQRHWLGDDRDKPPPLLVGLDRVPGQLHQPGGDLQRHGHVQDADDRRQQVGRRRAQGLGVGQARSQRHAHGQRRGDLLVQSERERHAQRPDGGRRGDAERTELVGVLARFAQPRLALPMVGILELRLVQPCPGAVTEDVCRSAQARHLLLQSHRRERHPTS